MTNEHSIPDATDRAILNARLLATGADTGFWDEYGRPTPWPDDIDEWRPSTSDPRIPEPGAQPF